MVVSMIMANRFLGGWPFDQTCPVHDKDGAVLDGQYTLCEREQYGSMLYSPEVRAAAAACVHPDATTTGIHGLRSKACHEALSVASDSVHWVGGDQVCVHDLGLQVRFPLISGVR